MVFKKYGKVMLSSIIFVVFTAITGYSIGMTNGKQILEENAIISQQENQQQNDQNNAVADNNSDSQKEEKKEDKKDNKDKNKKVSRKSPSKSSSSSSRRSSGGSNVSIPNKLKDGEYFGESNGYGGPVKVKVVVSGGKIKDVSVVSHTETPSYFDKAIAVASKIVSAQSTNVDSVSGATITSDAIKSAVGQALKNAGDTSGGSTSSSNDSAKVAELNKKIEELNKKIQELNLQKEEVKLGELKDGKYEGEGQGFKNNIKVAVTIEKGKIKSIYILDNGGDDAPYFDKAKALISDIISKQTTKVDSVTGATYSSNGIKLAVNSALRKAGGGGKVDDTELKALNDKINKLTEEKDNFETEVKKLKKDVDAKNAEIGKLNSGKTLKDGVYDGESKGYKGRDFAVRVTVEKGKIKSVEITKSTEDEPFISDAKTLIPKIIEKNSPQVDVVSDATYSSNAIKDGVRNALKNAYSEEGNKLFDLEKLVETLKSSLLEKDKLIESLKATINAKDEEIKKKDEIIKSGDGSSNNGHSEPKKTLKTGEFKGKAKGHKGEVEVNVVMKDGVIKSIQLLKNEDDKSYEEEAKKIIESLIVPEKFEKITKVYDEFYSLSEKVINKNNDGLPESIVSKLGKLNYPTTSDENEIGSFTTKVSRYVSKYLVSKDATTQDILDVTSGSTRTASAIVRAVQNAIGE